MSIDLTKVTYGVVVGPGDGITINKVSFGVVVGPDPGITITKATYGVIVDTLTIPPSGRRRQIVN